MRKQLGEFQHQLWRRKVMEAVAAGLIGLLVSFLLIFGLDRVWQTPGWARLAILLGGVSLFAGFAPYWLHRWVWGHRHEGQLARLISKRFPGLGDRLLGVIELQEQEEANDSLSPRLRAAAMEVVAGEAGKRDLRTALPAAQHRKWALAAIFLMAVVATAFVVTPKAGLNALARWLMPFSAVERYTFTQLETPPRYLAVPFGEAFEVSLKLAGASEQKPVAAMAQYGLQPELSANLTGKNYVFRFPGQQEPGTVIFRVGDLRHSLRVEPMQRPNVEVMRVKVKSPDYMKIADMSLEMTTGEVSAVEGSELVFEMEMNRPLRSGFYGPGKASGEMAKEEVLEPIDGQLEVSGRKVVTQAIRIGAVPFELPFSWVDRKGLSGGADFKLRVNAVKDAPPVAYMQGLERQKAILPEESVDFEILGEDDFGLKQIGIEWESFASMGEKEPAVKGELIMGKGGPEERRMMKPVVFSPAAFGLAPQKLVLRSFSEDFFPERGRVYSEPVLIYVPTREEHAQLLKSQFDRAISELEDLSRKELNLLDENQRLERLEADDLQKEENQKRLDSQELAEAENTQRMAELKERMEDVMKGAARNGDIDKETLKKMAEALKSMQELAEKDMPEVRDQLGEAQEQSNTPEKSKQDVAEAVENQKKVVEKIKKALDQANDANKRFEASTFVSRLKKAASEQSGIAGNLIESFSKILGVREDEVDPSDQRRLADAQRQQMLTAADVRWIQEDLGHYHARTSEPSFKDILDKMRESMIDLGMEDVRVKLQANHSFTATEGAKKWADKLSEWARILGDEMDKSGGGGGGGDGPSPEDEDFEFMLRVMKMIQQQQDLRARTRVLEQLRRDGGASAQLIQ
ncbi:MAG: hypothetical protein H7Y36_03270 [Armatimonadetes bacterium]|nr:hypothetical protein [Akkermansiaceae bacterium]